MTRKLGFRYDRFIIYLRKEVRDGILGRYTPSGIVGVVILMATTKKSRIIGSIGQIWMTTDGQVLRKIVDLVWPDRHSNVAKSYPS